MTDLQQELQQGLAHHQAGRLPSARLCYEAILRRDPKNLQALHLLGVLCLYSGKPEEALGLLRRCIALEPRFAEAHSNLGSALLAAHQPEAAVAAHERALALAPTLAEAHCNLGNALHALHQPEPAIAAYQRAITLKPGLAEAHNNLGNVLKAAARLDEAEACYRRALALRPAYFDACYNLANTLLARREFEAAIPLYHNVLTLAPGHAEAANQLGTALLALKRVPEAEAAFRRSAALRPEFAPAHTNLGSALQAQNRLDEALLAYQTALALDPRHFDTLCNLGNACVAQNRLPDGVAAYARALAERPASPDARYNLALAQLLAGDFAAGWEGYEARWDCDPAKRRRAYDQPLWTGEPFPRGTRILLHAEQGLGDTLQFVRYAPLLAARGARVYLEVQAPLKTLLSGTTATTAPETAPGLLPGVADVVAKGEPLPPFDLHCPLLSLPRVFATRLDSIPAKTPYLGAPAPHTLTWRDFFSRQDADRADRSDRPGRRIGLVWSGNPGHKNDHNRSIPFAAFSRVIGLGGAPAGAVGNGNADARARAADRFYSLQKDVRPADAAALATESAITDLAPHLRDFADTAAIIGQLDLVITVDTSLAHLAGALGTPTWLLLPFAPDWRWLLDRADSPWYPGMRLFRQPDVGNWPAVIEAVRRALDA